jgi:broad specificity phosphatase PhoE
MSILYLVRHGQAGTRGDYDALSQRGRSQARLLAEYFSRQAIQFSAAVSGSLARQRETAEEIRQGMPNGMPAIEIDPGWDEFDLAAVLAEIAPRLAAADEHFRREYARLQADIEASAGLDDAPVHRRWHECDKQAVLEWVAGRYEVSGESWLAFEERVQAAFRRIAAARQGENMIVFTSATPIGICAAATLDTGGEMAMRLAGVQYNASFTTLRLRGAGARLLSLNAVPHLQEAELRTFR